MRRITDKELAEWRSSNLRDEGGSLEQELRLINEVVRLRAIEAAAKPLSDEVLDSPKEPRWFLLTQLARELRAALAAKHPTDAEEGMTT